MFCIVAQKSWYESQDPKALNFVVASAGRFRLPVTVDAVRQLLQTGADLPYQAKAAGARLGPFMDHFACPGRNRH
jgi:hypothetical protein